jgi:hypothetical protein
MIKPQIPPSPGALFEPQKVADGHWTIRAQTPAGEILYIGSFANEPDAEAWIVLRGSVWWDEQRVPR